MLISGIFIFLFLFIIDVDLNFNKFAEKSDNGI
jgi:hypothetical protein